MTRIRELRKEKGITQEQLAQRLGLSQGMVSYWERNSYEPSIDTLKQLANLFDVTLDYLLARTDSPYPLYDVGDGGVPIDGLYLRLAREAQDKRLPKEALQAISALFDEFLTANRAV